MVLFLILSLLASIDCPRPRPDISFEILPIPEHAFFEQPQFQGLLGDHLFEISGFTPKVSDFARVGLPEVLTD